MKKIIYSNYTKFIAAILFIISIVSGVLIITGGISDFFKEKKSVYHFENDFSESLYISNLLDQPENVVFNAYHNFYYADDGENETGIGETPLSVNGETIEQNIEQRLDGLYCADKINYYIQWNGRVFTNCGAASAEELMQGPFYSYIEKNGAQDIERERSTKAKYYGHLLDTIVRYDDTSTIILCTNIKEKHLAESKAVWERQESIVNDTFTEAFCFAAVALLLLVYLICVCGKDKAGERKMLWIDTIWAEIHLAAMGGFGLGAIMICSVILDSCSSGHFPHMMTNMVVGCVSALASIIILTSLLSIIRNIKNKKFVASSIIIRIIKRTWKIFVKVISWFCRKAKSFKVVIAGTLSQKTGAVLISMLFAYTVIIALCCLLTFVNFIVFAVWILFGFFAFGFACFVVSYRAKDLDEVKKGAAEIRNGNLQYKIPELKSEDMKALAGNINEIGEGLEKTVADKMRAERLKTDLITNVSHDLKTPLTSIISYTELLSGVAGLPGEAKDYIDIIAKKSERLKNLTRDLFDVSKAQSGNETFVSEKLDAALLISQALGEQDSEIQKSELPFCVRTQKDLCFMADGRKMSRVLGNLIDNALRYAMQNTRVFVSAYEKGEAVVMEIKNTSACPMEFDAEEITGRFVRGDAARTDGGNGLGLAIAKTYTEACGGTFEIIIDGDLFKAILTFEKI